jgi:1-acyl-sn-glycerol-3-phosphate acyltransferase
MSILDVTWPFFTHFVSKKDLFKIPLIGFLMKMGGQIPIDRENLKAAIGSLDTATLAVIEEKKTLSIAPEGTRRRSPSNGPEGLMPFKKGPFHVAKTTKVDIVPVVIIGANRLFKPGQMIPTAGKNSFIDSQPIRYCYCQIS